MLTRTDNPSALSPVIVVICGPPGAGKTTIATAARRRLAARDGPVRSYHSDEFSRRTYDRLYDRVQDAPTDAVVLVDGTFYQRKWHALFRTFESVRFVHVTASLETCLERNRRREDSIDPQGVHVVYREFEAPDADLVIDTDENSAEEAVERLIEAVSTWR
ncbi:AAA family ATPase [Natrialbaceae archaeon A-arb3/5]